MAKYKILVPIGANLTTLLMNNDLEKEALAGLDVEFIELKGPSDDELIAAGRDCDAVYTKGAKISKKVIDSLHKCRAIVIGSVGVDPIDVVAATAKGIPVTNCPDTFIEEVADHAMMLILSTFRNVVQQDRMVREGNWREGRAQLLQNPRLQGLTLGFIAFGHVPRAVSRRAKPFGVRMIAYDPFVEEQVMPDFDVLPMSLEEVLAQSDIISMHAPATPEAQGMLTEKHFRQMKKTAIFINTGRGPTVDEPALIKALQERWIAQAGLDVLEKEPPGDNNPLLRMDNVILTAHVASASARFDPARKRRVGRELSLILTGKWPMSCVNPSVLAKSPLQRWQPVSMLRGPNS